MIELAIAFLSGIMYGLAGVTVARKVETPINLVMLERGLNPAYGVYITFMVTLLWPVLVVLAAFTISYATVRGAGE